MQDNYLGLMLAMITKGTNFCKVTITCVYDHFMKDGDPFNEIVTVLCKVAQTHSKHLWCGLFVFTLKRKVDVPNSEIWVRCGSVFKLKLLILFEDQKQNLFFERDTLNIICFDVGYGNTSNHLKPLTIDGHILITWCWNFIDSIVQVSLKTFYLRKCLVGFSSAQNVHHILDAPPTLSSKCLEMENQGFLVEWAMVSSTPQSMEGQRLSSKKHGEMLTSLISLLC